MSKACQITGRLISIVGIVALMVTGFSSAASADDQVDAVTIVVVSDDIMKKTTNVERGAAPEDKAENNRSGLGDGTNPGKAGMVYSGKNEGTDNPNNSKK
jgi:hypothetical protein